MSRLRFLGNTTNNIQSVSVLTAIAVLVILPWVLSLPWFEWSRNEGIEQGVLCDGGSVGTQSTSDLLNLWPQPDCVGCGCMDVERWVVEPDASYVREVGWLGRGFTFLIVISNILIIFLSDLKQHWKISILMFMLLIFSCIACLMFFEEIGVSNYNDPMFKNHAWHLKRIIPLGPIILSLMLSPVIIRAIAFFHQNRT